MVALEELFRDAVTISTSGKTSRGGDEGMKKTTLESNHHVTAHSLIHRGYYIKVAEVWCYQGLILIMRKPNKYN